MNHSSHQCLHWWQQQSAGLLHINGFDFHILTSTNKKTTQVGGFFIGGGEGQPVLTTKLSKDYIYSFRWDTGVLS